MRDEGSGPPTNQTRNWVHRAISTRARTEGAARHGARSRPPSPSTGWTLRRCAMLELTRGTSVYHGDGHASGFIQMIWSDPGLKAKCITAQTHGQNQCKLGFLEESYRKRGLSTMCFWTIFNEFYHKKFSSQLSVWTFSPYQRIPGLFSYAIFASSDPVPLRPDPRPAQFGGVWRGGNPSFRRVHPSISPQWRYQLFKFI